MNAMNTRSILKKFVVVQNAYYPSNSLSLYVAASIVFDGRDNWPSPTKPTGAGWKADYYGASYYTRSGRTHDGYNSSENWWVDISSSNYNPCNDYEYDTSYVFARESGDHSNWVTKMSIVHQVSVHAGVVGYVVDRIKVLHPPVTEKDANWVLFSKGVYGVKSPYEGDPAYDAIQDSMYDSWARKVTVTKVGGRYVAVYVTYNECKDKRGAASIMAKVFRVLAKEGLNPRVVAGTGFTG